jgi:uncharacterized membrane protein YeaQ/YmgE (transglycosylase-associated protein family)
MIGALLLGLVAGVLGKLLMPGRDPGGFLVTILLGLAGAGLGWVIFTLALGIGDDDAFDLGGLVSAIIGVMILLFAYRQLFATRAAPAAPITHDERGDRIAERREHRRHREPPQ